MGKDCVRIGIIGVGGMGSHHARYLQEGKVSRARLAAICDIDPARLKAFKDVRGYASSDELIASGEVDAVLIATPHYGHTTIGIAALKAGLHVLVEKPISVHKADCERLIAAYRKRPRKSQVFSAMFNQRTSPHFARLRKLIQDGELGEIRRTNWIITNWFRTQAYYNSGGWRATWAGEGGGVLLNQCPHNLDLFQWICGMPSTVHAFCGFGKHHAIEVEDEVTAYLEYPNGATGVFITSTGEAPGTNRLEITGDRGKIILEDGAIKFTRNEIPSNVFLKTSPTGFSTPPVWHVDIPVGGTATQHPGITQNFVNAILDHTPLLAPAVEGIHSVELGNAMVLSALTGRKVDIPMSGAAYERVLKKLMATSKIKKAASKSVVANLSKTFGS
jgi:predicted dehydrogenase